MQVIKRNGKKEPVSFDKIAERIQKLRSMDPASGTLAGADPMLVTQRVVAGMVDGMTTSDIDEFAAETSAYMSTMHSDYGVLAGRISVSNLHKNTDSSFSETVRKLFESNSTVSESFWEIVKENAEILDKTIDHTRDYGYDYFGFKTLVRSYLLKIDTRVVERPQYAIMRTAVGIHGRDVPAVIETYNLMSRRVFTHATPTLFNAGTRMPQMSSCFLLKIKEDSIEGIFSTLQQCALISKSAGGIGINVHDVRSAGTQIGGTNGQSNGIVPMLRVFDTTARYVDQGGGKRKGSIAVYLEPWHADIFDFLPMKRNQGKEELKARDLFYAMWIPDLFMRRVEADKEWTLFCPNKAPGLADVYGKEFDELYERYESQGLGNRSVSARDLWKEIMVTQIETGTPYVMFKDACNSKSNQKNLGTTRCSNLCTEIVQYTSKDEVAVCNLASISLPAFLGEDFDHQELHRVCGVIVRNLNRIIDANWYPVPEARRSNERHRPIGVGVQGLADLFAAKGYPFDSEEARALNVSIFETILHGCLQASVELAEIDGPYETFPGSPASQGILQFDMWPGTKPSSRWDWDTLRQRIVTSGLRNSLLTTVMPTASTAQILGNNESIEAFTSNLYARKTLAGDFFVVNKWLVRDLEKVGLWDAKMRESIMRRDGSIQGIPGIPDKLKAVYRTVWEIPQRHIVEMAAARGPYIDQSQSLNIHMVDAAPAKVSSMHFAVWKSGLKGTYYLRTQTKTKPIAFTIPQEQEVQKPQEEEECTMCSS